MKPDTTDLVARLEGLLEKARQSTMDAGVTVGLRQTNPLPAIRAAEADWANVAEAITALPALLAAVREGEAAPTITDEMRERYYDLFPYSPGSESWTMARYPSIEDMLAVFFPSPPTHTNTEGSNGS